MIRHMVTVLSGSTASRVLGFLRDAIVAALLGAGIVADAFLMAFQLVTVMRRLLSEGALNAALVPTWLRIRDADGEAAAAGFAGRVLGTVTTAMIAAAILLGIAMPVVVALLTPGFVGQPSLPLAVNDARLMLPYLAFVGPVAVMLGLLNAQHRFGLTAFAPVLFNIAMISVAATLLMMRPDAAIAALILAGTVGVAGLLQLVVLVTGRRGAASATPVRIAFDRQMRGFFRKAISGAMASSAPQLFAVAGAIAASFSPSAVSWLYFAGRLIELPLGIVGTAMGAVLLPELTRAVRDGDAAALAHAQSRGLELALGLALPATIGLIVLRKPIVRALFEHGAFDAADTAATATALGVLALALPAHVIAKTLAPAFFARDNTATPFLAALKALAIAIALSIVLGRVFGTAGIAASIAIGAWNYAFSLLRKGAESFGFSIDAAARRRLPRIVLAALVMGGLLWLKATYVLPLADGANGVVRAAMLGILITGAVAIYGGLLMLFGALAWRDAVDALKRDAPPAAQG